MGHGVEERERVGKEKGTGGRTVRINLPSKSYIDNMLNRQ